MPDLADLVTSVDSSESSVVLLLRRVLSSLGVERRMVDLMTVRMKVEKRESSGIRTYIVRYGDHMDQINPREHHEMEEEDKSIDVNRLGDKFVTINSQQTARKCDYQEMV